MINLFPYTDAHELNLDWVVEQVKANNTKVKDLTHTVENLHFDFDSKADKAMTYTKTEVDTLLLTKADVTEFNNYYNKGETDSLLAGKADMSSLATVATSGNYNDLLNKPTIPAAQVNADWNAVSGVAQILNKPTIPAAQVNSDWDAVSGVAQILNKPTLAAVATSGSCNDLLDKPTASTAQDGIYVDGNQKLYYITFGKMVIVCGRISVTTAKPAGQSNWLFSLLPVPTSGIASVYSDTNVSLIINTSGYLTSNLAVAAGYYNVMAAYIQV